MRQFAQTEARSLTQRTQPAGQAALPEAVCLVAAVPSSRGQDNPAGQEIAGTLDIRPPASAGGQFPEGVPGCTPGSQASAQQKYCCIACIIKALDLKLLDCHTSGNPPTLPCKKRN